MVIGRGVVVRSAIGLTCVLLVSGLALAQPGGRGGPGGFPGGRGGPGGFPGMGGPGGFGGGPLQLVQREDVQGELKITESQIEKIESLADEQRESMRDQFGQFGDFQNMSDEERQDAMAKMRERRTSQQKELGKQIGEILNKEQQTRLAQLEFQFNLQRGDLMGALSAGGMELQQADEEKLRDAQQEAEAKIADLRTKAFVEAIGSVVDEAKVKELMGESFAFEQMGPPGFGRQGGGRRQGDAARPSRNREGADADQAPPRGRRTEDRGERRNRAAR